MPKTLKILMVYCYFHHRAEKYDFYINFHSFSENQKILIFHENSQNSEDLRNSPKKMKSFNSCRDLKFIKFHEILDNSLKIMNFLKFNEIHRSLVNFSLFTSKAGNVAVARARMLKCWRNFDYIWKTSGNAVF